MIYTAVFALSFSSLAFEILLTRIFSISQGHHLYFMVISIALLGFSAGGIGLSFLSRRGVPWEIRFSAPLPLSTFLAAYCLSIISTLVFLNQMPLDYFKLPVAPVQGLYIFLTYLVLAIPFFICGTVFSMAYAAFPDRTGFVYFFSMTGSAAGAVAPLLFLGMMDESEMVLFTGLAPLTTIPFFRPWSKQANKTQPEFQSLQKKRWQLALFITVAGMVMVLVTGAKYDFFEIRPSDYKALSRILKFPDTKIQKTVLDIRGRMDFLSSVFLRYAPGLSIQYKGELPSQQAIYVDGDSAVVLYTSGQGQSHDFARHTLERAGYLAEPPPLSALLLLKDGGSSIPCAIASNVKDIVVVNENPVIARHIREVYGIPAIAENPRSYLKNTRRQYDVIHIDNRGPSLPGTSALIQEYTFTEEAFASYFSHLTLQGRLIFTRNLILPPADMVRMCATAFKCLKMVGIANPEKHMAILRNWNSYALILCRRPFTETERMKDFALKLNFDWVHLPGITPDMANRFNVFDEPFYFIAIQDLILAHAASTEKTYFKNSLSNVSPRTDDCPFPHKHLKWWKLGDTFQSTGNRPYSLFLSGEILVVVVFIEALCVCALLFLLPLRVFSRHGRHSGGFAIMNYFFWIGAGFMFAELYFIKSLTLAFEHPVISFAAVLACVLLATGLGGFLSQSFSQDRLGAVLWIAVGILLLMLIFVPFALSWILGLSRPFKLIASMLIIVIPGVIMGFPFSLGMRWLAVNADQRAMAWAANGAASVLAAVLSEHIALNAGIGAVLLSGIMAYVFAFFSLPRKGFSKTAFVHRDP